jgi:hypothetical protein
MNDSQYITYMKTNKGLGLLHVRINNVTPLNNNMKLGTSRLRVKIAGQGYQNILDL